ncbi:MAG: hypothetical protein RLY14_2813 [Planctomycetota bacterium]|jgi:hypothetical protein
MFDSGGIGNADRIKYSHCDSWIFWFGQKRPRQWFLDGVGLRRIEKGRYLIGISGQRSFLTSFLSKYLDGAFLRPPLKLGFRMVLEID